VEQSSTITNSRSMFSGSGAASTIARLFSTTVRSSPLVRTIARSEGLGVAELDRIAGTGAGGRVTKGDVLTFLEQRPAAAAGAHVFGAPQADRVVPMDRMRQLIAHHMVASIQTSAHVYIMTDADVTDLVAFRKRHKESFEERTGEKLTYTPFFIKASALALRDFPMVNAQVNPEAQQITIKGQVNVGMAVAVPKDDGSFGLIVPVIRDADLLPLREIARRVNDLAARGRAGKLAPDEPQGGTFTVTNMGVFGSYGGLAIINQPQVAILGLGAIARRPAVVGDDVVARDKVFLTVGIDHRLVDGALGGQFLERIRHYLENIDSWLLA
jgi:2-oxoglutarate dehydrogenase E2 component (dihydrolipoamide succinyltransferase)